MMRSHACTNSDGEREERDENREEQDVGHDGVPSARALVSRRCRHTFFYARPLPKSPVLTRF